jgi:hypothetical protein
MWAALGWMALGGFIVLLIIIAIYIDAAKKVRW